MYLCNICVRHRWHKRVLVSFVFGDIVPEFGDNPTVEPFSLSVAVRVVHRRFQVFNSEHRSKFSEQFDCKLNAVVR